MINKVILKTESVSKFFGALKAVNSVDFEVHSKRIHGLIGPNGAGKTTLFNILTGYYKVSGGRVLFKGEDITNVPPRKIVSKGIARTFQITNIFNNLTCYENIALGGLRPRKAHRNFWSLSKEENLSKYDYLREIVELIKLEEWKLKTKAGFLSYPDQRLLEIGVALASSPELLLLDEPLAGLGAESVEDIKNAIIDVSKKTDIVIVDHNLDAIIELCDIITVMHDGEILFTGIPEEIRTNKEVERVYLKG